MTSIIDRHATDSQTIHECGGTILSARHAGDAYHYCDRCGAYRYGDGMIPAGTDAAANQAAWDDGELESPAAPDED